MNATTRKVVNVGYGLALALLAANALLAYLDIRAIVRGNWWVQHSREVVAQLERAASTLKDAETGQRGYLLTGKDEYLGPYVDAANGLDKDLDRLFTLTADNPEQQARLAELRRIAGEKIDELGRTVALMRKGDRDAALAVVQTDRGKALMDRARTLVVEMRGEEDRLLTQRSAAATNAVWRAVASVVVATIIVALSLLLVAYLKRREDSERDRAVEALRLSEEWLTRMMESIGDGVVATDGRGRVRLMNPVAERLTGWPEAEAVGRPLEEVFRIVNEETRRPAENPVIRAVREGVVMGLANHTVLIARGGAETPIEDSAAPIKDKSGTVVGVVMVFQDATGRRRHEAALRESEGRHRTILESITDAFFALDREWRFTYVNRQAESLLGRGRGDLLGRSLWVEYPDTLGNVIERNYRRAMGEGVTVEFDEFYPPHDRWYENHLYPSPDGLSVYFRDITDRKRAEADRDLLVEKVDEERRHLQALIESSPDCIKELDLGGRLVAVSGNGQKLLEIRDLCDFLDKPWLDFWPGGEREMAERALSRALAGGVGSFEGFCPTAAGTPKWWDVVVTPILDHEGKPHRLLSVSRDITDRRRHQEERDRLLAEAEAANRAKTQFLAVLSHELRTPLNPILLAASSMLDRPCEPEEIRPTLEMIRQNVKLQARLIDDLLDVMRIVQGKMPLQWGVADCHALIGQSVEICRSEFLGKAQELVLDLAAEDHHVNADSARLQQVLWNLVRNAVKFTPEGGRIAVRTRNEDNGEGHVVVEVADTGIGIEPHVLPTIFDPFQQGETTITRRFGGLGLGLAICKGVVDAHGGTLAVDSEGPGRGTTFRVVLKTVPEPEVEAKVGGNGEAQSPPHPLFRLNILLVEDEAATLRLMARLLKGLGHRVTAAGTVADAWDAFQVGDFDLIVSDIGLPDGTGLDLMRRVKAARPVPAIALTGYGMDEDVRRSREAGFTTHMTKPIDFSKLEAMIRQVAN